METFADLTNVNPTQKDVVVIVPGGSAPSWEMLRDFRAYLYDSMIAVEYIKQEVDRLMPDSAWRRIALTRLAESIEEANSYGQSKWAVHHYHDKIRLLVGGNILFTIHGAEIWLSLDKQSLCHEIEKYQALRTSDSWRWDRKVYPTYSSIGSINGYYSLSAHDAKMWPIVQELHFIAIQKAANKYPQLRVTSQNRHSDLFLCYLKHELNLEQIPFPDYGRDFVSPEEITDEDEEILQEGWSKQITVNAYERDRTARRRCIQEYGFACSVCGFVFEDGYGKKGRGYIHVHHLTPLSTKKQKHIVDPIKDLRPVCPNCHAMLHHTGLSIEELKKKVRFSWWSGRQ